MSLFARGEADGGWMCIMCVCGGGRGEVLFLFYFFEEGAKLRAVSTVTGKAL